MAAYSSGRTERSMRRDSVDLDKWHVLFTGGGGGILLYTVKRAGDRSTTG